MAAVAGCIRHLPLAPRELALLCQQVENLEVGAPCRRDGSDYFRFAAKSSRYWRCSASPPSCKETVALPAELAVWGLRFGRSAIRSVEAITVRGASALLWAIASFT
jgi:hypothetical protein